MIRVRSLVGILAIAAALVPSPGEAQRADRLQRQQQQRQLESGEQTPLARQFQLRLAEVVRRRLNLNDAQMQQLGQVNGKYERQRMQLLRRERQARQEMRRQMAFPDSADQRRVSDLINETLRIQRERLDLTEREQQELSQFMTPMQRAMYFGIQDEVRRRMEEMRQQGRPGAAQGRPGALRPRALPRQP
jgi:hypothetical protein